MPSVSELLIRIDATTEGLRRELQRAGTQLNSFGNNVERDLTSIDNSFAKLGRGIGGIQSALGALGLAFGGVELARGFIELSDTATTVQNRLRSVTGSADELRSAYNALFASSQENAVSIEDSVNLYARLMNALERTGITSNEVVEIVDTLGKTAKISGMSAAETASAMQQLSQAFNSGFLMGEEFNTMADAMPSLLNAVAQEMSAISGESFEDTRAALKEMASDGQVSVDVLIAAIQNMRDETVSDFEKVEGTVSDATTRMWNSLTDFVGKLDDVGGASDNVRDKIDALSSVFNFASGVIDTYGGSLRSLMNILDAIPTPLETLISLAKIGHEELQKLINFAKNAANTVSESAKGILSGARKPSPVMRLGMQLGQQYKDEISEFIAPTQNVLTGGAKSGFHPGVIDWTVSKDIQDAWSRFNKDVTARAMGGKAPAPTDAEGNLVIEVTKGTAAKETQKAAAPRAWRPPTLTKEDQRTLERIRKSTSDARDEYQARIAELDDLAKRNKISSELYLEGLKAAESEYQRGVEAEKKPKTEAERAAKKAADDRKREVKRLFEATRTPKEAYEAEVAELNQLRAGKAIDEDLYKRAVASAKEDYEEAIKPKKKRKGPKTEEEKAQERAEREGKGISRDVMTITEEYNAKIARLDELLARNAITHEEHAKAVAEAGIAMRQSQMTFDGSRDAARAYLDEVERLKGQLASGAISQDEYNLRILEAQERYAEAKSNSASYADEIARLDQALADGAISHEEYAASVDVARNSMSKAAQEGAALAEEMRTPLERYNAEMERLEELWRSDAIGDETKMRKQTQLMNEYHQELIATNDHLQRMKDMSDDLGSAMAGAFEDAIVEGGKLRDILDSLWKDIQRIVVRQLVTIPLASGISAMIGGVLGVPGAGMAGRQHGGIVSGPGTGTSDSVPSLLSAGEFVVNAQSTRRHRAMLEAINDNRLGGMTGIPRFAAGGFVGSGSSPSSPGQIELKIENKSQTPLRIEGAQQRKGPNSKQIISVMVNDAVKAALDAGEFDRSMGSRYGAAVQPISR